MTTDIINIDNDESSALEQAMNTLKSGGVIAFPTETVYGVGCDLRNKNAVNNIYKLKNRPADKPVTLYIHNLKQAEEYCMNIPDIFYKLADRFLPGPLSVILRKKDLVPYNVTSGMDTISLRMPDHPFLLKLLEKYQAPVAGTSANLSGKPAFRSGRDIYDNLGSFAQEELLSLILDGGDSKLGVESTLISLVDGDIQVLREGAISRRDLAV